MKRRFWAHQLVEYIIGIAAIAAGAQSNEPMFPCIGGALLLLNDPGVDSYRLSADICQTQKLGDALPDRDPYPAEVGLVLAYAGQPGADGVPVHTLMVFGFTEYDPANADARRNLELKDVGVVAPPGLTARAPSIVRDVPVAPLPKTVPLGPNWRPLSVDVTPAGVWVPGRNGQPQLADAAGIAGRRLGPRAGGAMSLRDMVDAAPPAWSPRMPVGIWCRGSAVAVRNVTIQALK